MEKFLQSRVKFIRKNYLQHRKKSLSSLSSLTTRDPVQGIEPWSSRKNQAVLPLDHTRDPVRGIEPRSIRENQIVLPLDDTRIVPLVGVEPTTTPLD